jgi:hypothetical protein
MEILPDIVYLVNGDALYVNEIEVRKLTAKPVGR